jgi:hypothetical protein
VEALVAISDVARLERGLSPDSLFSLYREPDENRSRVAVTAAEVSKESIRLEPRLKILVQDDVESPAEDNLGVQSNDINLGWSFLPNVITSQVGRMAR